MLQNDGPATQHVGRTQGMGIRERLLIVATLAFVGGTLLLAADQGRPGQVAAEGTLPPSPTSVVASPTSSPATPSPAGAATPFGSFEFVPPEAPR